MEIRRDKIVARILLIFFIANAVLAAPVVVRQRHLGDKSMDDSSDSSQVTSGPGYLPDSEVPSDPETSSGPETLTMLSDGHDTSSSTKSIHESLSTLDTSHYYSDQLSEIHFDPVTKARFGLAPEPWYWSLRSAGVPASGPQQLNDPPPTSGNPPSQDHPTSELKAWLEAAQLHNQPSGSGDQPLHDYSLPWWHDRFPLMPAVEEPEQEQEQEEHKVELKGLCGPVSCLDWHSIRPFE